MTIHEQGFVTSTQPAIEPMTSQPMLKVMWLAGFPPMLGRIPQEAGDGSQNTTCRRPTNVTDMSVHAVNALIQRVPRVNQSFHYTCDTSECYYVVDEEHIADDSLTQWQCLRANGVMVSQAHRHTAYCFMDSVHVHPSSSSTISLLPTFHSLLSLSSPSQSRFHPSECDHLLHSLYAGTSK